jgi:4-alpha-glucanotransferase
MEPSHLPWLSTEEIDVVRQGLGGVIDAAKVNYPEVRKAKRLLLEMAWAGFQTDAMGLEAEFRQFQADEDWLEDYSIFRYMMERFGEALTWDQWPEACQSPEGARLHLQALEKIEGGRVLLRLEFYQFIQWLCFRQWRELRKEADAAGVKLMGDVPIGVHWHSSDVFFHREEFDLDWCGGSPPEGMGQSDPFFQQWGQNWGIPLYRWDRMEANGFQWWKKRISRLTEFFQMFRLDHILGFYRIYAFPWRPERNGEWLGMSHEEVARHTGGRLPKWVPRADDSVENKLANRDDAGLRLRAILDASGGAEVIAEDLGWVPEYVRPHLAELGIAGFRIPHWDCDDHGHPTLGEFYPENSFAAYSTHDHDSICGIWRACLNTIQNYQQNPIESARWQMNGAQQTLRILSEFAEIYISEQSPWPPFTEGVRLRLVKALLDSNSCYASLMVTTLFGLGDRINHPGTRSPDNWSFRLPWTLSEIRGDMQLNEICRKFAAAIQITRRADALGKLGLPVG